MQDFAKRMAFVSHVKDRGNYNRASHMEEYCGPSPEVGESRVCLKNCQDPDADEAYSADV